MSSLVLTRPDTPMNRCLLRAIDRNDGALAAQALANGASPFAVTARGPSSTLFARAIVRGKDAVVRAIVESGADPAFVVVERAEDASNTWERDPAFLDQVRHGPVDRTREWLERFPQLRTADMLRRALFSSPRKESSEMFDLILETVRQLPVSVWRKNVLESGFGVWVKFLPVERLKRVHGLSPISLSAEALAQGLHAAVLAHKPDAVDWLLGLGAEPDRPAGFNARESARQACVSRNHKNLLRRFEQSHPRNFDAVRWEQELKQALEKKSLGVYRQLWAIAPLPDEEKRRRVGVLKIKATVVRGERAELSPVESVCMDLPGSKIPGLLLQVLQTSHTTTEDRSRAVHLMCRTHFSDARLARAALNTLAAAGVDWSVIHPLLGGDLTARQRALGHPTLGPAVAEWFAKKEARDLAGSLEAGETPSPRTRRHRF